LERNAVSHTQVLYALSDLNNLAHNLIARIDLALPGQCSGRDTLITQSLNE
jgi:hypothetical protein